MPPVDQVLELNCELPHHKSTTARGQAAMDYESQEERGEVAHRD